MTRTELPRMGRPPIPESSKRKQVCLTVSQATLAALESMGPNKGRAVDRLVSEAAAREGSSVATSACAPKRAQ